MKVPAVAIVAIFACGIVLGLSFPVALPYPSTAILAICFSAAALLILAGILLLKLEKLVTAAMASLLSWTLLGVLGALLIVQPRPADHVLTLMETGRLDLQTPLRWHGRLRDEPSRLPWGYGYEIELSRVDYRGSTLAARGGMRLSFAPRDGEQAALDLHAGDEVAVVAQAKRPQVYKDDGAFDRRAYLEQQNIHLLATLRAAELLERVSSQALTLGSALPRARHVLRGELDALFRQAPQVAGVLRAMLLGDRSFVDRDEATDFQKTGVFHVLVVAGLHAGALAAFLFLITRTLRLPLTWSMLLTLSLPFCLRSHRGTAAPGAASRNYGLNRCFERILLPSAGFTELCCVSGINSVGRKSPCDSRFELSTHLCGHRVYRGSRCALARAHNAALREGPSRLA